MTQGMLFREEALAALEKVNKAFMADALEAIGYASRFSDDFIVDDVWDKMPFDAPVSDKRAMGAAMNRAHKLGMIVPTEKFRASKQAQCHANPRRVWRAA